MNSGAPVPFALAIHWPPQDAHCVFALPKTISGPSATLISATNDALTKAVGVSLDDQLTHMLDVERSYQTSAKLLAAIDSMLGDLMQAVR